MSRWIYVRSGPKFRERSSAHRSSHVLAPCPRGHLLPEVRSDDRKGSYDGAAAVHAATGVAAGDEGKRTGWDLRAQEAEVREPEPVYELPDTRLEAAPEEGRDEESEVVSGRARTTTD